jgi:pyruvate formate lyase activating enzyme
MTLPILGLIPTSMIDYPKHITSVIFTGGCNLKCPYCHNHEMIDDHESKFTYEEIIDKIRNNKIVDAVTITGGEPTYFGPALFNFMEILKKELPEHKIKLDTNGLKFHTLEYCWEMIDYLAVDLKALPYLYFNFKVKESSYRIHQNFLRLKDKIEEDNRIEVEYRTTYFKEVLNDNIIRVMNELYVPNKCIHYIQKVNNEKTLEKIEKVKDEEFIDFMKKIKYNRIRTR